MQVSPQLVPGVICGRWAAEGRRDDGRGGSEQGEENVVRVEVALTGGADCGGERLLGGGALPGAIAAADFARYHGGTDGLFGPAVGREGFPVKWATHTWTLSAV